MPKRHVSVTTLYMPYAQPDEVWSGTVSAVLTEKSDSEALQHASPPAQKEVAAGVGQEADGPPDEGDEEIHHGQIDDNVI